MNADGSGQTQLTTSPASDVDPTWSPEGSRLVFTRIGFTSSKVDLAHIWVMNDDGSWHTQLTKGPEPIHFPLGRLTAPRSPSPVATSTSLSKPTSS